MNEAGDLEVLDIGYLVSRVMQCYGMSYWEVIDTPVDAFWMLNKNIDRLRAELDLRLLENRLMGSTGNAETLTRYQERLKSEMGLVALEKPKLDVAGLQRLKALGRGL